MGSLPASLPNGRLPETYENARLALSECTKVDECKTWADKAAAIASYAKQADDKSLEAMAIKIRARATRRCGQLLQEFDARGKTKKDGTDHSSISKQASDAGLSERQTKNATRLARIPDDTFDELIESDKPPTITELADMGTRKIDTLLGRKIEDVEAATDCKMWLRKLNKVTSHPAHKIKSGFISDDDITELRQLVGDVLPWLTKLNEDLEK